MGLLEQRSRIISETVEELEARGYKTNPHDIAVITAAASVAVAQAAARKIEGSNVQ